MYSKKLTKGEVLRSDHIVPVKIDVLRKLKEDGVLIGSSKFVRLQICSKIAEKLVDEARNVLKLRLESDFWVEKAFTTSFRRETADTLKINDYVSIAGKIRLTENGTPFLNAFSVRKSCEMEHKSFEFEAEFCQKFYENNTSSYMPRNSPISTLCGELNLGNFGLARFPLGMLENCSVVGKDEQKITENTNNDDDEDEDSFENFGRN